METGIVRLFVLFALFLFLGYVYVKTIQKFYSPALLCIILFYIHTYRKDKFFIQLSFEKKNIVLYWLEYSIISLPFLLISLYKGYYIDFLLYVLIVLVAPLIFRYRIKGFSVNCCLFRKGSYEYQLSFRNNYRLSVLFYFLALAGLFHDNRNMFFVFYGLVGLLYIFPLLNTEPLIYTANFLCIKDLIEVKLKNILFNNLVLYLPLFVVCVIKNIHWTATLIFLYFWIVLLSFCSLLIRYANDSHIVTAIIFFVVLLPASVVFLIYPPVGLAVFLPIVLMSFQKANYRLNKLFDYASNRPSV
jgi:hypothetical protein